MFYNTYIRIILSNNAKVKEQGSLTIYFHVHNFLLFISEISKY